MGLFSFIKDAGKKLFKSKDEEVAANPTISETEIYAGRTAMMRQKFQELGININNFDVRFEADGDILITGEAQTKADFEKVTLFAGNIAGIATVNNMVTLAPGAEAEADAGTYEVVKGDSLWKIAEKHYGNGAHYKAIFEANQPLIKNEDEIYPGQILRIPSMN